jgi:hypothetical protein
MAEPESTVRKYQLVGPSDSGEVSDLLADLDEKESRHRLQALIAEWLRMENLVVLTGAGTSVSSGGKTMDKLENTVLETVKAMEDLPAGAATIIEARQKKRKKKIGFEDWLSFLVNAHHFGTAPDSMFDGAKWKATPEPSQKDLSWLIDRIGKAIFAECALPLAETSSFAARSAADIPPHLSFLAKLVARDSNLGRAHLFTLNYDTLFEQAMETLGIQYFDGFTGRADARFDPSIYGLDIYYPGEVSEGRVRRFDKFIHFYKLHGSIHWQVRADEMRARHPDLQRFKGYLSTDDPAEKARWLARHKGSISVIGILPTANKFVQTLAMPFAHLFRLFQIRLASPQTFLLVLGYGFGDDHVTRIIETALMNPSLVMLVVEPNPYSETIERIRRYKDLGKRAFVLTPTEAAFEETKFKYATFDDFAHSIMPDVQWLDDFLRLRRFEKQIAAESGMKTKRDDGA